MFFDGITFGLNYWVLWGRPQSGAKLSVAFYSFDKGNTWEPLGPLHYVDANGRQQQLNLFTIKEAHFYHGRWYIMAERSVGARVYISQGGNPKSSKGYLYTLWPRKSGVRIDSTESFDISDVLTYGSVGRNGYNFDKGDGEWIRSCASCSRNFHHESRKIRYQNGIWRVLGGEGAFHYSFDLEEYYDLRHGNGQLNDILGF